MKTISSFEVDHTRLLPGLYVSRKDRVGKNMVTTFDLRVCRPNFEPVMKTCEYHTIEHLAATYMRNHEKYGKDIIYFGPMGCSTGFYLLMAGNLDVADVLDFVKDCFKYMASYDGDVPGASMEACGNYTDLNLSLAKSRAAAYLETLESASADQFIYPD